jgi:predicted nuclease of predicted toxin-antitoxin system
MTARLLFDHNLPMRLIMRLGDIFQDANHVYLAGLDQAPDSEIRQFARDHDYAIVTKDSDFSDLSILLGAPPKVIWLRIGNASVKECEIVLRNHYLPIAVFLDAPDVSLMSIPHW